MKVRYHAREDIVEVHGIRFPADVFRAMQTVQPDRGYVIHNLSGEVQVDEVAFQATDMKKAFAAANQENDRAAGTPVEAAAAPAIGHSYTSLESLAERASQPPAEGQPETFSQMCLRREREEQAKARH